MITGVYWNMKKQVTAVLAMLLLSIGALYAQRHRVDSLIDQYRRNSIYTLLVEHPDKKFGSEIKQEFLKLPVPDKYNDHNLWVRSVVAAQGRDQLAHIEKLFLQEQVAKHLVSKWFNRNAATGAFDMDLIAERGYYDASWVDVEKAEQTARGIKMLADLGEELIGNTFVVVNDIRYIDKERNAQIASEVFSMFSAIAGAVSNDASAAAGTTNNKTSNISDLVSSVSDLGGAISDMIAGFTVNITSYLFQLEWNEACANEFYVKYYYEDPVVDPAKRSGYDADGQLFSLKFVGKYKSKSDKTVLRGVNSNEEVIRKVCARALDKNIVNLQKKYEAFKVKAPIVEIKDKRVCCPIGKKEGVTSKSKYEVLEAVLDKNGKTDYKRVGIIKPVSEKIWDNRYMAIEENAEGADLKYTEFQIVKGNNFYPGMLVRELK